MKLISILLVLTLFSCIPEYRGYEKYNDNVQYKLISLGESEEQIKDSTYLRLMYRYCSTDNCENDTIFQTNFLYTDTKTYLNFWNRFHVGDQFVVLFGPNSWPYWRLLFDFKDKKVQWPVIIEVHIASSYDNNLKFIGESDSEFLKWREENILTRLKYSQPTQKEKGKKYAEKNGCFISVSNVGYGDSVKNGSEVALSYKAYFSTGKKFDDTDLWADSMKFIYGQPFQIIKGLELGIQGLREGCETEIIIPSHLAFGEQGSSSGIVPPFEPLLYDLKIISVSNLPL